MALQNKDSVFQNMSSGFPYQQQQYQQAPPPYNPPSRYGMPQQGMGGMPQQGMGMHQQGMGGMPQQGMGMQQQGMGMQQQGMGMPQQGMGMQQQGMGMPQQGMGMQQQGMGGMPQQGMGMHQQGMGMMSMPQGGDNGPQNPLEKKVMVLYIIPGDQISMQAYQMVVDYPEILVQDARAINPRPTWLTRVPTVVMVTNKMVYDGAQAFQVLTGYIQNIRIMNGAQDQMVVNTVNPNEGFAVVDKTQHYKACADDQRMAAVPVGTASRTAMAVGQVNFTVEDDPRYSQIDKGISEETVNRYMSQRQQPRQRPVQWRPSVLENGEFVSM